MRQFCKSLVVLLVCLMLPCTTISGETKSDPADGQVTIDQLLGTYEVVSVMRYRGGLTTATEANSRLGEIVVVGKQGLSDRDFTIDKPVFELEIVEDLPEGHIPSRQTTKFYGLGLERSPVIILRGYGVDSDSHQQVVEFEVIDENTLWQAYDGWVFELIRIEVKRDSDLGTAE